MNQTPLLLIAVLIVAFIECGKDEPLSAEPFPQSPVSRQSSKTFTNSIGMKLNLIPAGTFMMGSPASEAYRADDETQHRVTLTKDFYLGATEVTQGQWESVMGTTPWKRQEFVQEGGNHAASYVSWDDAVEFCNRLSAKEGMDCRLPTEAEWEYACRAGITTAYSFGEDASQLNDYGWWGGIFGDGNTKSEQYAHAVGVKQANGFGLYDMHGNVYEWCSDWYGDYPTGSVTDPQGAAVGASRVRRGGSWVYDAAHCRSASRRTITPSSLYPNFGFRLALSPVGPGDASVRPAAALQASPSTNAPVPTGEASEHISPQTPPIPIAPFSENEAKSHQAVWAAYLDQPVELTNSIGMKLMLIPPGEFLMGSPKDEADRQSSELENRVRITKPYYVGMHEVTQGEYERVMGTNPSWFSVSGKGSKKITGMDTTRFPVEQISWEDAVEYCRRLSALPAERAAGRVYRLPTEAEWEYACRAGTTTPFHFGSQLIGQQANFDGSRPYGITTKGPYLERTTTMGSYLANGYGLFDMHGNVWEWCSDWYGDYTPSAQVDPLGAATGSDPVVRGGGWSNDAGNCRSANRSGGTPDSRDGLVGFRVALSSVVEQSSAGP